MPKREELPPCELCGNDGAIVIDGISWCEGCLHARGSCCAESEMVERDEDEEGKIVPL